MSTWAPNVRVVLDNGYGSSRRGNDVIGAITHHVAGFDGRDYVANYNSRSSHPTYHISRNGTVTGIVHPDRKPSSTGGSIDSSCITVEIDNTSVGGDWPVSQAALDAWSVIVRHHADESIRAGRAIEKNIPGKLQNGFFVGWHSQYVETACPGPFVISHLGGVIARANGVSMPSSSTPTPINTPIDLGDTMKLLKVPNGTIALVGEHEAVIYTQASGGQAFSQGVNGKAYGVVDGLTGDEVTTLVNEARARRTALINDIAVTVLKNIPASSGGTAPAIDLSAIAKAVNDDAASRLAK